MFESKTASLTERALHHKYAVDRALSAPSALLLPSHVAQMLVNQAQLLVDIARKVDDHG